jgi:DNA-binding CsgD family transcriptional regulator
VLEERFDDAGRHRERATELSRASQQRIVSMGLLVGRGQVLAFKGQIAELAEVTEALLEEALLSSSSMFLSWAMSLKCVLELRRGDLYAAVGFGEHGLSAGTAAASPLAWSARGCLAEALLEIGETRPAESSSCPPTVPSCCHRFRNTKLATTNFSPAQNSRAASSTAQPSSPSARRWSRNACPDSACPSRRLSARGRSSCWSGANPRQPRNRRSHRCDPAEAAGALVEVARSRILLGKALVAGGQRDRAVGELQRAHGELISCGALRYCDEAAHELRKLGHAVRAAPQAPDGGLIGALTPRELQVIERLAAGKTNRQIAEDLCLSVRTVERHTARIFEKLGINSRAAAASAFERARASV